MIRLGAALLWVIVAATAFGQRAANAPAVEDAELARAMRHRGAIKNALHAAARQRFPADHTGFPHRSWIRCRCQRAAHICANALDLRRDIRHRSGSDFHSPRGAHLAVLEAPEGPPRSPARRTFPHSKGMP